MEEPLDEATRELLRSMTPRLRAYLHALLGDWDGAEDVLQDVFIKFLQRGPNAQDDYAPRWLFTVARNAALSWKRGQRRRMAREQKHADAWPPVGEEDPAEATAKRETIARIEACLLQLPVEMREVLHWKVIAGLSYGEVGERVGAPKSTVALRVRDALILLNRCFHGSG